MLQSQNYKNPMKKKSMPMATSKFNKLKPVSSILVLRDPITDEVVVENGQPVTITMVGYNTKQFLTNTVNKGRRAKLFMDEFADETGELAANTAPEKIADFQLVQRAHDIACHVTGWSHDALFGGAYSPETAVAFFTDIQNVVIAHQVEQHRDTRENFFPK